MLSHSNAQAFMIFFWPVLPSSEPQLWPVGMVLEGSSEALCPPPSLELRPSCNKSQPSPPLGSSSQPHDGVFPEDKEPVKYGELVVLGYDIKVLWCTSDVNFMNLPDYTGVFHSYLEFLVFLSSQSFINWNGPWSWTSSSESWHIPTNPTLSNQDCNNAHKHRKSINL